MELPPHIIGHREQLRELAENLAGGRTAHAYLLSGRKHVGKFTVAKWFAAEVLLQGRSEQERIRDLALIQRNLHPDLLVLDQLWIEGVCTDWHTISRSSNVPQEERAKRHAKTNTISIDDVRELQRRLHETAQTGKLCCLIRSLERLNAEAGNALLKILEEPPPQVLFCCTTESVGSLPATIVSRMRQITFHPLPPRELLPLLSGFDEEDRPFLLRIAQGAPGILFRFQEDPTSTRGLRQISANAQRFLDSPSVLERLQQMLAALEGGGASTFLEHLFLHLRPLLASPDPAKLQHALSHLRPLLALTQAATSNVQKPLLAAEFALRSSFP